MKCQILFSGENKKNIINLSSAENAQRVVKVKERLAENFMRELFMILARYSFLIIFIKAYVVGTHFNCLDLSWRNRYKYMGCILKTTKSFDFALIGACAVIILNRVNNVEKAVKHQIISMTKPASVAQLDAPSDWRPGGRGFNPCQDRQHSFVEIDHEIFSTVILSLPLIQEGQLSVSGERMCTILVNRLED